MRGTLPVGTLFVAAIAAHPGLAGAQASWRAARLPADEAPAHATGSRNEAALLALAFDGMTRHFAEPERAGLREVTRAELDRLHARYPQGIPSLLEASHTVRQGPAAFDALIAEPEGDTDRAVVFLHGFGGNALLPCAVVAEAADRAGAMTICPSLGGAGHWRGAAGARVLDATLDWLTERRGIRRVVLAGLSNGGIGASRLAARCGPRLAGLVLISGAAHGTRTALPALVIHGDADTMTAPGAARAFARRSPRATLHEVPGNHFVLLHRRAELVEAMGAWLRPVLAAQ